MSDCVPFYDLPATAFPFTVNAYPEQSTTDTDPVWTMLVTGPGALAVPGLKETGQRVRIVVRYADGVVSRDGDS